MMRLDGDEKFGGMLRRLGGLFLLDRLICGLRGGRRFDFLLETRLSRRARLFVV